MRYSAEISPENEAPEGPFGRGYESRDLDLQVISVSRGTSSSTDSGSLHILTVNFVFFLLSLFRDFVSFYQLDVFCDLITACISLSSLLLLDNYLEFPNDHVFLYEFLYIHFHACSSLEIVRNSET